MKMKFLALALSVLAILKTEAQTYNITKIESKNYSNLIGYYKNYSLWHINENQILLINKDRATDFKYVTLNTQGYIYYADLVLHEDALYYLNEKYDYATEADKKKNSYRYNKVEMMAFDPMTGEVKNRNNFKYQPDKSSISCFLDTSLKHIIVTEGDSQVVAFDLNLKESKSVQYKKKKAEKDFFYDSDIDLDFLRDIFKNSDIFKNLSITIDGGNAKDTLTDRTSDIANFKYEKIKDKELFFFQKYYQNFTVLKKDSSKTYSIDFGQDRKILEFYHKDLADGNLLIFGKWIQIEGSMKYFGLYSLLLDKNLKEVGKMKIFDLDKINTSYGELPNKKYTGLIYTRLKSFDYTFYNEELKVTVNTYQKEYSNLIDHIYVLKIQDDGEIIVNWVVNQTRNNTKKNYLNQGYSAFMKKDKLYILFYDHLKNFDNAVYDDKNFVETDMGGKETLLVSCSYDINEDNFSSKQKVADKTTVKDFLDLEDAEVMKNESNESVSLYINAKNKKGNTNSLYVMSFVE